MSTTPVTTKKDQQPSLLAAAEVKTKKPLPVSTGITEMIVDIPLALIAPSPYNPRKLFDDNYIAGLASSIASSGLHRPVLLREWVARAEDIQLALDHGFDPNFEPGANIFQLVSGECRCRGSIKAGKETIQSIVRALTNEQVEEIAIIENLQEDLSPLEEAEGYHALMTISANRQKPMTGQEIAARIGKSPQYVSSMVKLCALAEWGKQILRNGWITPGHAVLIARIADFEGQDVAMRAVFNLGSMVGPTMVGLVKQRVDANAPMMSEKALRNWIAENIRCDLKSVPWNLADADLVSAAGACDGCQFRTATDQALFADINPNREDRCTKPSCFAQKRAAHIRSEQENARLSNQLLQQISTADANAPALPNSTILKSGQWVPARRGECKPGTVRAIFINGEQEGHTPFVCVDAKCKVHKHPAVAVPMETKIPEPLTTEDTKEHGGKAGNDPEFNKTPAGIKAAGPYNPGATVVETGGRGLPAPADKEAELYRKANPGFTGAIGGIEQERDQRMEAQRLRAVAAVKELMVHRVLAAQAAHEQKDIFSILRMACEYHMENSYIDHDRVVAGLGWDPDKFPNAEPIGETLESGTLAERARLLWLLMVPDSIDIESDRVKSWAKARKLNLEKIQVDLEEKLSHCCSYCFCTELTPCDGGCYLKQAIKPAGVFCTSEACKKKFALEHGGQLDAFMCVPVGTKTQTSVNQKPSAPTKVLAAAPAKTKEKATGKSAGATQAKPSPVAAKVKTKPPAKTVKPKAKSQLPKTAASPKAAPGKQKSAKKAKGRK
jgi:ParB/RepB/Spo0J family partition protein